VTLASINLKNSSPGRQLDIFVGHDQWPPASHLRNPPACAQPPPRERILLPARCACALSSAVPFYRRAKPGAEGKRKCAGSFDGCRTSGGNNCVRKLLREGPRHLRLTHPLREPELPPNRRRGGTRIATRSRSSGRTGQPSHQGFRRHRRCDRRVLAGRILRWWRSSQRIRARPTQGRSGCA
jgi:hypothetical protein